MDWNCHCCFCCRDRGCRPCGYKKTALSKKLKNYATVPSGETLIKNLTLAESNRYMEAINGARKMRERRVSLMKERKWWGYEKWDKEFLNNWWKWAHAN